MIPRSGVSISLFHIYGEATQTTGTLLRIWYDAAGINPYYYLSLPGSSPSHACFNDPKETSSGRDLTTLLARTPRVGGHNSLFLAYPWRPPNTLIMQSYPLIVIGHSIHLPSPPFLLQAILGVYYMSLGLCARVYNYPCLPLDQQPIFRIHFLLLLWKGLLLRIQSSYSRGIHNSSDRQRIRYWVYYIPINNLSIFSL